MAASIIPKGNYFLVGLGIGSLIGILFAPKSGEETIRADSEVRASSVQERRIEMSLP
jgi:gas vesicle protein